MGKTNLGRVTFVPRGAYNNEVAYKRLDVVESKGSSYLFLKDSTGVVPTGDGEVTMLLAKRGKDFAYEDFTPEQLAALKGADGAKGDKGDPGKGLTILGYYGTLDLLKAGVTTPEPGDAYGIGTEAPYDIYVFDGITSDWVDNGTMSRGGEDGWKVVGIPGAVLYLGNNSTSDEIISAFGGISAMEGIWRSLMYGNNIVTSINSNPGTPLGFRTSNSYLSYDIRFGLDTPYKLSLSFLNEDGAIVKINTIGKMQVGWENNLFYATITEYVQLLTDTNVDFSLGSSEVKLVASGEVVRDLLSRVEALENKLK